jgi:ring-1,2-phenylacetyl-CoA epoxidase subunit PaaE
MSAHFIATKITDVRRETHDCVSIAFEIPSAYRDAFKFVAGQYVNLRAVIDGEEVRRSYSLCSTPHSNEWRVAVKRVEGGRFSEFVNASIRVGDAIDVMPPDGKFRFEPVPDAARSLRRCSSGKRNRR